MPNRSGKSAAAFIGKAACCFLQLIRFLLGFMQINYARMQQTGQPFLSCFGTYAAAAFALHRQADVMRTTG